MRPRRIHPIVTGIVRTALRTCNGVRFHTGPVCETCGGRLSGYDERKKRFAILLDDGVACPLHVIIRRSYCLRCGRIAVPEETFYPGTRIGSPVVDLCQSLSRTMPYSRISSYLGRMGVQVNRWSARQYSCMHLPEVPSIKLFGLQIPTSILALSGLPRPGSEPLNPTMDDVLRACNYPSDPFRAGIPGREEPAGSEEQKKQQRYIEELLNRISPAPGIIFIVFCLLAGVFSDTIIAEGLLDAAGREMEMLAI